MSVDEQLSAIEGGVGRLALPEGDVLRLVGGDALAALDRVVSQEVKSLHDGDGRLALLLAPKGQFRAMLAVFRVGPEPLLLAPAGRGAELAAALNGFLKFSRVAAEPLGWGGGATLLLGPGRLRAARSAGLDAATVASGGGACTGPAGDRSIWLGRTFAGVEGAVVVGESETARRLADEALAAAGAVPLDPAAVELARVGRGFPAWGAELTGAVLPPEVGLENVTISYTKGCYVGQETIARMKAYGHPTRALVGVRCTAGPDTAPVLPLQLAAAGDEKARGSLTSWVRHPRHGVAGLALVRRELALPGTVLAASGRTFAVSPLPLW